MQWELSMLGSGGWRVKVPLNQKAHRYFAVTRDKCNGHQKGTEVDPSLSPKIYMLTTGRLKCLMSMHRQPSEQLLATSKIKAQRHWIGTSFNTWLVQLILCHVHPPKDIWNSVTLINFSSNCIGCEIGRLQVSWSNITGCDEFQLPDIYRKFQVKSNLYQSNRPIAMKNINVGTKQFRLYQALLWWREMAKEHLGTTTSMPVGKCISDGLMAISLYRPNALPAQLAACKIGQTEGHIHFNSAKHHYENRLRISHCPEICATHSTKINSFQLLQLIIQNNPLPANQLIEKSSINIKKQRYL